VPKVTPEKKEEDREKTGRLTYPPESKIVLPTDLDQLLELKIFYDGKPIPRQGLTVPAPQPGQKVHFTLKSTEKLGVVLQINGINTIGAERNADINNLSQWILEPNKEYVVNGVYEVSGKARELVAVPPSDKDLAELGKGAGLINVDLFRERRPNDNVPLPKVVARALRLDTVAGNVTELKGQLRKAVAARTLILPGQGIEGKVETTTFEAAHCGGYSIRYYEYAQPLYPVVTP